MPGRNDSELWLLEGAVLPIRGYLRCLETFLTVLVGAGPAAIGNEWVEARAAAEHPTMHRSALTAQSY